MAELWGAVMLIAGGLFAGGAATFAWSRVPIWRRMTPPEFIRDFEQTIRWTDRVQPALLVAAAAAAVAFAITVEGGARIFALAGAGGFALVLVASLAVMVPLQRRIIATPASDANVEAMRLQWFTGNLGRSILSIASFTLMAIAAVV